MGGKSASYAQLFAQIMGIYLFKKLPLEFRTWRLQL
jgi:hypothetical protein